MPRSFRTGSLSRPILVLLLLVGPLVSAPSRASEALASRIAPLVEAHRGKVAVAVKHLERGERYDLRGDEPMPTASLIKLPIMVEAYRQAEAGKLDLDRTITLREADKVPGSGLLTTRFSEGASFPLRDAIRLMIADSDNTATNLVLEQTGIREVSASMETLGLPDTKLNGKLYRRDASVFPERSQRFGLGSTTALGMIQLLERLHQRKLVSPASDDAMIEHLKACADTSMIPRFLPEGTAVAHKVGGIGDIRTDAGILYTPGGPVALCVLTAENEDRRATPDNRAERLVAEVGREVYNHFNQGVDPTAEPVALKQGDSGRPVEDLQRALNARLDPSPDLSVDGEYGPATESAVLRFQAANGLPANGQADARTVKALGPPPGEPVVPAPEEVNARNEPKQPADPLDGQPFVTAKGWVVFNAGTGEVLAGSNADASLDMASTTKIMTALVVLRMAKEQPAVLDEVVTFSERADRTSGSTAGVRAGERLSVRELLFGLLLPSGNDASVALGEHFGNRCGPIEGNPDEADPLAKFVAAMNRTAKTLGLAETTFANTHGLTAPGHRSSPRDLARLASEALADPTFSITVSTRRRGCVLVDPQGRTRNVAWTNTNRLLDVEGYDGVKTGTTSAAGACLVASGRRGGDQLIVVVLGAGSSDGRYADARNLFRWAWGRLAQDRP